MNMSQLLPYFILGILVGATCSGLVLYRLLRKARHDAAELESQLRSHSFELQVTLD